MTPTNKELDIPAVGKSLPVDVAKELTDEQRDEIATLSYSNLNDKLYPTHLNNINTNNFSNFNKTYNEQFQNNKKFTTNTTNQPNPTNKNTTQPNTYINQKKTKHKLIYNYTEINGHYFRNL